MAPIVREQTVKAVLTVITKLSDRTINGELLKYLAKTSNDEQPGIRTNTTICLGKISKYLGVGSRSKVLIAAFTRSLRDPFVHARNASLLALGVTSEFFSDDDCASRILPSLCPCLVDKEKLVRDQANKTLDMYLQRVRKFATTMPDSVLPPPTTSEATATTPRMSTPQPSEAASWAGWAISSFTNKISTAAGEIEPSSNGTPISETRPSSAPIPNDTKRLVPGTSSASTLHRQAVTSPAATSARTSTSSNRNDYFREPNEAEDDAEAWGDMQEEAFFDAPSQAPKIAPSAANPFGEEGEPDFEGWLAAQAGKKPGSKPLPKGLAKATTLTSNRPVAMGRVASTGGGGLGSKKAAGTALKPKPVVAKKIDTAPKATDNDDGWGDGW